MARRLRELRDVGLLQRVEPARDADAVAERLHGVDEALRLRQLVGVGLVAGGADAPRELGQPRRRRFEGEAQHRRQHDGVGQPVRRVVQAAELVRDGVHVADVGARERHAGVRRRQRHALARVQVVALRVGARQVLEDRGDGGEREAVGRRRRPQADVGFDRMRQRIHPGGRGHRRRQSRHQRRVERRHVGHDARVGDDELAVLRGVGDHRRHRHLRAGARRRRHGVDRHRAAPAAEVAGQRLRRLAVRSRERDDLRRVEHRAAADREHGVAALAAHHVQPALDDRDRRVGRDLVEDDEFAAGGRERLGQRREQAQLRDHRVGDDEDAAVAEVTDRARQPRRGAGADHQQRLRNRHEPRHDAGRALDGRQTHRPRHVADQIADHSSSPSFGLKTPRRSAAAKARV